MVTVNSWVNGQKHASR